MVNSAARHNILNTYCHQIVTNCSDYDASGKCTACSNDPATNEKLFAAGSACIPYSVYLTSGCLEYPLNNFLIAGCLKCKPGWGTVADGCKLSVGNCTSFTTNGAVTYCDTCASTHKLTNKYQCVENLFKRLDGCTTAFNSTTCMQCTSGNVLIVNSDV